MAHVRVLESNERGDSYALLIDDRHIVAVGPFNITRITHQSYDRYPMEVLYHPHDGYLVTVQTY